MHLHRVDSDCHKKNKSGVGTLWYTASTAVPSLNLCSWSPMCVLKAHSCSWLNRAHKRCSTIVLSRWMWGGRWVPYSGIVHIDSAIWLLLRCCSSSWTLVPSQNSGYGVCNWRSWIRWRTCIFRGAKIICIHLSVVSLTRRISAYVSAFRFIETTITHPGFPFW